jgi:hypothetical protein
MSEMLVFERFLFDKTSFQLRTVSQLGRPHALPASEG